MILENLLLVLTVLLIAYIWCVRKSVSAVTEEKWSKLKDGECYHVTKNEYLGGIMQTNGEVYLKKSKGFFVNMLSPKECVYFSKKKPGLINTILLRLQSRNVVVVIKLKDLERENLLIRGLDGSLLFTSEYRGPGTVESWPA